MENKLKALFSYQKFENNARLNTLIDETHSRCGEALSDDQLEMVSAAGTFEDSYPRNPDDPQNKYCP